MKTIALSLLLPISQLFAQQSNAVIELSLTNQHSSAGKIYVAIYNSEQSFGIPEKAYLTDIIEAKKPFLASIELKSGNYAIAVYQDINNNGKLDKNWVGIPTEPYGFSKDPLIRFGPPLYEDCQLHIQGKNIISIRLR
jgi:uncharacterized protein (DUF2141 family)